MFAATHMKVLKSLALTLLLSHAWAGCKKAENNSLGPVSPIPAATTISTEKALYSPGQTVTFTISPTPTAAIKVRYKHLGAVIKEEVITAPSWTWVPPTTDFTGYLVELYKNAPNGQEQVDATIAVDVSSDWAKFPRYGFLTKFGNISQDEIAAVIKKLNRYHINGIQFYDWQYKHHQPFAGDPVNPTLIYQEIGGNDVYYNTVKRYIETARAAGMKSMFYNLVFGAWNDAAADGVQEAWYIYTDAQRTNKDLHRLPTPPFRSSIYLLDPSNPQWQAYMVGQNNKVYAGLPFDGFHMDQLGPRGTVYTYNGRPLALDNSYGSFIQSMHAARPDKRIVMNAVNNFGQRSIASPIPDFLYTEVWNDFASSYTDLSRVIRDNNNFSSNTKNSVLAAYMNYNKAVAGRGTFNTPGVLMTNAVIFAFGGSHLEMGEHMLCSEYFPNSNLTMDADLQSAMPVYYDFLTGYQNLLRDGGSLVFPTVSTSSSTVQVGSWPAIQGQVSTVGRSVGNRMALHLLNYKGARHMDWRDDGGNQAAPELVTNLPLTVAVTGPVRRIWMASPDVSKGAAQELSFTQTGNNINLVVPYLKYWTMVVVEY